nr:zinc finger SWIM domain-containing protein 4-like [Dermatophagoides pteronyssinus]
MQQPNKEWTIRLRNQNSSSHHSTVGRSSRIPSDLTAIPSSSSSTITTGTDLINPNSLVGQKSSYEPESLLEIAARFVAEYIPYEYIEQQYSCIPEPVQKRIIFWSFPRDERYIRLYSSISSIFKQDFNLANYTNGTTTAAAVGTSSSSNLSMNIPSSPSLLWDLVGNPMTTATTTTTTTASHHDHEWESRSTFNKGLHLLCSGTVRQVMQIGFNLTGIVIDLQNNKQSHSSAQSSGSFHSTISPYLSSSAIQSSSSSSEANFSKLFQGDRIGNYPYNNHNILDSSSTYRKANFNGCLVSITFDRCKITSATCTCTPRVVHLFWCEHVVALALYRIHKPFSFDLRIPISETLLDLDRQQLQKLVQYLIAEHHVQILPTVQRLTDELSQKQAPINLIHGAPDPTAGACVYGPHDWYLNEERTASQIRDLVKYVSISESNKIILLFYKVIEMLKIKDSNGSRFLRIITEQFLYSYSHYLKPEDAFDQMYFDPFIFLWDHLTNLWTFIVADPSLPPLKRVEWREMFRHWSHISNCPREDTYFNLNVQTTHDTPHRCSSSSDNEPMAHCSKHERRLIVNASRNGHNVPFRKRRILERALDASYITWDDEHLQLILRQDGPVDGKSRQFYYSEDFDKDGFPIWSEHLPTACVRVASLRVNGRLQEALRLSMAIVRLFRHRQHIQEQENIGLIHVVQSSDSWIGNPLDPIGILFDTLAEASVTSDSRSYDAHYALIGYDKKIDMGIFSRNVLVDVFVMYNEVNGLVDKDGNMASNVNDNNDSNNEKLKFNHVKVPGSTQYWDTYLNAAVYIALVGLSQIRRSPDLESQRDRSYRQEERLIRKLLDIKLDSFLISTVQKKARYLIEYGILSDMVTGEHRQLFVPSDIVQIPGLVRYMFGALLPTHPDLSYDIGLRSLRFFAFKDEHQSSSEADQLPVRSNFFDMYLDVQSLLARTMLFAARNDYAQLLLIFETIKTYVIDPHYLNKLAQDIFNFSSNGNRQEYLLRIAYQFGLHLAKITLNDQTNDSCRKNTIHWLVTCATEIGYDKIVYLMRNWKEYFSPSEAVRQVASAVLAQNFNSRLCVRDHIMRSEELASTARKLAVECAMRDPSSCALNALSLCEKDQYAFDTIAKVVETAASLNQIGSHKLFSIARYLEHQGASERACKIALLAANQVTIPLTADSHHSINDLQWACSLAQCLGTEELNKLVDILIKNVRCAPVLADMIRRCTLPHPVLPKPVMIGQNNIRSNNINLSYVSDSSNIVMEHLSIEERMRRRQFQTYPLDRPPLCNLLYAAVKAYIEAVMRRLEHISPRHYGDFIEFLTRAQETIILAPDGKNEFVKLLEKIKTLYKGKKKLMCLVRERFN